jgi:radical SAM protein with 4Fe4S-binding SPASM domain
MWSRPWDVDQELSLEQWIRAADILADAGVRVVEIFGGDVLLRKDVLIPLIKHFKKRDVAIHIPTNCNLLDRETAKALVESCVDSLYLSTDGVGDSQDAVRGIEDSFGKVRDAVKELVGARNGIDVPRLVCNTTVSKFNVDSLEDIARFAVEAGFDEVHYEYVGEMTPEDVSGSFVDGIEPTAYYLRGDESVLVTREQIGSLREKLRSLRKEYLAGPFGVTTLNIDTVSDDNLVAGSFPSKKCYVERCEVTIDPGGNVVACPFFHSFHLGNILENDFQDIWWGERHTYFHEHLKNEGLAMCRHCIFNIQRNHTFFTRLRRICLTSIRAVRGKLMGLTA